MPSIDADNELLVVSEPTRAGSSPDHGGTTSATSVDLRRHVPRIALEWDDDSPDRPWQRIDATLVFADISGFTALTEKLARRGRIGAEELIETLNRVFGAMLDQAALRGGELLKFGGDALLFAFRGDDHAMRACRSAVDMRQALREAAKVPTSVGRLRLSMSVGIHTGPVDFFLVGAPTRELLVLGPAATATAEAEHAAVAGEILITEGTAQRLPPGSTEPRPEGLYKLKWRLTHPPEGEAPPSPEVTQARLRTLLPVALGEHLDATVPEPEHKVATIGFARFSGTDVMLASKGPDAVAQALHDTLSVFEEALIAEGVTLLATDLDSDGGKLFLGSGVPFSSEDDEGRMLRALRRVIDRGTPLPVQLGVNRGHVFAAEVGTARRAAYSAMGDTTNTAARIMSKAPAGVMYAHPSVLEQSRTLFATEPAGPFPMKGKTVPVLVHAVGDELGTRGSLHSSSSMPLLGRDAELEDVRSALEVALAGAGGVVTVAAETGLGKSRLVTEALRGVEATLVTVRAEPYGMTSPYRMLRDPVRAALGIDRGDPREMADALVARVGALMPDLLPLAPLLEDVVNVPIPPTPESAAIEPRYRPARIADMVVRLIESSVPGALVLLVEEGHWADNASIAILGRLADATDGRPWALVVARRVSDDGFLPTQGTHVVLPPLPVDVMRRIVIDATEAAPLRPHEIDDIVARAGGNPLYVEELVRVFREVGSLDAMPESLGAALAAQIDALDPHSRRVLRYASVLGRSFRREVLEQTLRSDDLVVDEATVARLRSFLEPDGHARLRFRTGMIRDAAYEGLAYRQRAKLHFAAGRAVQTLSSDLEADADTLSLHFWRAGDGAQTWRFARMAGDRAARAYANVDAGVQYERALEAARALPDIDEAQRLSLWQQLGEVRDRAGLYEDAIDAFDKALRIAKADPWMTAQLLMMRATTKLGIGSYLPALRDVNRAERLLAADNSIEARRLRVRLRARRGSIRQDQQRLAETLVEARAVEIEARAVDEYDALETALMALDAVAFQSGDTSVGDNTREAMESALAHGRNVRARVASANLAAFAFYTGRWDVSVDYLVRARALAMSIGDVVGAAKVGLSLGELYVNRGERELADEVLADSVRVLRSAGLAAERAYGVIHQAKSALDRGDLEGAERLATSAEAELIELSLPLFALEATLVRAEVFTARGRASEALELLEQAASTATGEGVALLPRLHLERARALLVLGEVESSSAEISTGLAVARQHDLAFEQARLHLLEADVAAARGDEAVREAALLEAHTIMAGLGVVRPAA